jgi:hypothetical protein
MDKVHFPLEDVRNDNDRQFLEINQEVSRIRSMAHDYEAAHSAEDALHRKVLTMIATGEAKDPAGLARAALTTRDVDYPRYTA